MVVAVYCLLVVNVFVALSARSANKRAEEAPRQAQAALDSVTVTVP